MRLYLFASLACLLFIVACSEAPRPTQVPRYFDPSPFAGTWLSEDNSDQYLFRLEIQQRSDTLFGYHCNYTFEGNVSDCNTPGLSAPTFVVVNTGESAFEAAYRSNQPAGDTGRVRLLLQDQRLFWQVIKAPESTHHTWMQSVLKPIQE